MILAGMAFGLAAIIEVKINVSRAQGIPQKYLLSLECFYQCLLVNPFNHCLP